EYIYDPSGQLSIATQQDLEELAQHLVEQRGHHIVLYIHRLTGRADSQITASRAEGLRQDWSVGADGQIGALVLIELDTDAYHAPARVAHRTQLPGEMYIAVAPGPAEPRLSPSDRREIEQKAVNPHASDDLDLAMQELVMRLSDSLIAPGLGVVSLVDDDFWAGLVAIVVLLSSLVVITVTWLGLVRRSHYRDSDWVLTAGPPNDIDVVAANILHARRATRSPLAIALLDLARLNLIELKHAGSYMVSAIGDGSVTALHSLSPLLQRLYLFIQLQGASIDASELNELDKPFTQLAEEQAQSQGLLRRPLPGQAAALWRLAGMLMLVLGLLLLLLTSFTAMFDGLRGYALLGAASAGAGAAAWLRSPFVSRRTRRGRWVSSVLMAYRSILSDAITQRQPLTVIAQLPLLRGLVTNEQQVLVWAVALGLGPRLPLVPDQESVVSKLPLLDWMTQAESVDDLRLEPRSI
ncbi:MAG TPA: TPM domain-containing protein, partial [Halomonas sp.]|nr:TPM domain-containing protein [Halomonas sp.]